MKKIFFVFYILLIIPFVMNSSFNSPSKEDLSVLSYQTNTSTRDRLNFKVRPKIKFEIEEVQDFLNQGGILFAIQSLLKENKDWIEFKKMNEDQARKQFSSLIHIALETKELVLSSNNL